MTSLPKPDRVLSKVLGLFGTVTIFLPASGSRLSALDAMSTPNLIHSLPNELLVAIASAGQEDRVADLTTLHSGWSTQPTAFCSEWALSYLSYRFRDVISGASELWTLTETNFAVEGSVEIFKLYLERSRACKISVTLREFPESNIIESGLPMWTGQIVVVAHLNRIWSLRILVRTWPGGADMLGLFRDAAARGHPHLRRGPVPESRWCRWIFFVWSPEAGFSQNRRIYTPSSGTVEGHAYTPRHSESRVHAFRDQSIPFVGSFAP